MLIRDRARFVASSPALLCAIILLVCGSVEAIRYTAHDLREYSDEVITEAKKLVGKRLVAEQSTTSKSSGGACPFSAMSKFLHARPYAKKLSYSAMTAMSAVELFQQRYGMSASEAIKKLNKHGVHKKILKSLPGKHLSDTKLPPAPGFDFCPYPTNVMCQLNSSFRTIDGSCNNLRNPLFGRSMTPFRRMMPPRYADGVNTIRRSVTGQPLPSARTISGQLLTDVDRSNSSQFTMALVFFGQFINHDMIETAPSKRLSGGTSGVLEDVTCGSDGCAYTSDPHDPCLPISVPPNDVDFSKFKCLTFVRSMPVPLLNCQLGPREQLNQITHWLDGSQVYGSSKDESDALRDLSQPSRGRMRVTEDANHAIKPLLPQDLTDNSCNGAGNSSAYCFKAGDDRVNENSALTSYHTIFIRQHNVLEEGLHSLNPNWNGERLFQEARRIVSAMLQHVTYTELLPLVLGRDIINGYGLNLLTQGYFTGYAGKLDARIPAEFSTAAYRFGHSLVQERIFRVNKQGKTNSNLWLSQTFFNISYVLDGPGSGGVDVFVRGAAQEQSQLADRFFTKQVTRSLFTPNPPIGLGTDLASINIQRGRDHGLPTYNDVREWCGLGRARSFADLGSVIDSDSLKGIQSVYSDVNDIDLFVGGVSENPTRGAAVGPTFACVIASTFQSLRRGDRFWYENKDAGFSTDQLQEIRKVKMARILCSNGDSISKIQPLVFFKPADPSDSNQPNAPVDCGSLPDINLSLWKEN